MTSDKIDFIKKWADTHIKPINLTDKEMASYERLCSGEEIDYEYFTEALAAYLAKNKKLWSYDDDSHMYKLLDPVMNNICNDELIEKIIDDLYYGYCQTDYDDYRQINATIFIDITVQNRAILDVLSEKLADIIGRQCVCQCYKNTQYIRCSVF